MGTSAPAGKPQTPYFELTARNAGRRVVRIHKVVVQIPPFLFEGEAERGVPIPDRIEYTIFGQHGTDEVVTLAEKEKHTFTEASFEIGMLHRLQTGKKAVATVEDSLGHLHEVKFWPTKPPTPKK